VANTPTFSRERLRSVRLRPLLQAILFAQCGASRFVRAEMAAAMSAVQAARVTEVSVGITEYATEQPGFRGTLKYRCADFIVREISLDRRVIKLRSTAPTAEMPPGSQAEAEKSEPALEGAARTEALALLIGQEQVRDCAPPTCLSCAWMPP